MTWLKCFLNFSHFWPKCFLTCFSTPVSRKMGWWHQGVKGIGNIDHQITHCEVNFRILTPSHLKRNIWHHSKANTSTIHRSMINLRWVQHFDLNWLFWESLARRLLAIRRYTSTSGMKHIGGGVHPLESLERYGVLGSVIHRHYNKLDWHP